jgi:hypothetical protein
LQIPTTGPPSLANTATAFITGEKGVARDGGSHRGRSRRDHDRVDTSDGVVAVPEDLGVAERPDGPMTSNSQFDPGRGRRRHGSHQTGAAARW